MTMDVKVIAQMVGASVIEIITPLVERIKALEARSAEKGEQGPAGEKGEQGEKGDQGSPGVNGERGEAGAQGSKGDSGERGESGSPGACGERGARGETGERGEAGAQGKSLTIDDVRDYLNAGLSMWLLEADREYRKRVDDAIAAMPKPKDGVDGLNIDRVELNEETRTLEFQHEGRVIHSIKLYYPRYEGVWNEVEYEKGLIVTFGGNLWSAVKDTQAKPGTNGDWILCVKKGRDGRDLK